jgi:two-component system nitrogen regulation response regulator NtrX
MNQAPTVLICDDDDTFHLAVKYALKNQFRCLSAKNGDEALVLLKKTSFDLVLLDIQMRTSDEGLRYLPKFLEIDPELSVIVASGVTDFNTVREAMKRGAADYVPKDFNIDDLGHTLHLALERRQLLKEKEQKDFELCTEQKKHVLIGESPQMKDIRKVIEKIKTSQANVIITGETGTGKEVVARQLRTVRKDGSLLPFVAVDSATIQSSMAESILFGHERGAFTGADQMKKGLFEEAHEGVIYFDEISNMPLEIQSKLLRVLQEKEVMRVGSSKAIPLEFKVICATNKNLEDLVRAGQFKDDLYQRLCVIPLELTPLRERKQDILPLIKHFIALNSSTEKTISFSDDAMELMKNYSWPGNVRELANLIAYLTAMIDGSEVLVQDLPSKMRETSQNRSSAQGSDEFYKRVQEFEKQVLGAEYEKFEGNVSRMANALGMDRSHLHTKLKLYGIHSKKTAQGETPS